MAVKNSVSINAKKPLHGFTLVELIVVITILVILGTIAFLQLSGFQGSARDGDRVLTVKNMDSALQAFQIKTGSYPMPDQNGSTPILSGSINGTTYSYLGVIGDVNARNARMNKVPVDPLSQNPYLYAVTADKKYYQIGATVEGTTANASAFPIAYAITPSQALVNGNYPGYFKFSSGSELWIANIPGLIWNNTGSLDLLSSGAYFVVNKGANLPYKLDATNVIQNRNANQIVQFVTGNQASSLTGVNITNITTASGVSTLFTGALLASFGGDVATLQTAVLGTAAVVTAVPSNCSLSGATVTHGASVTAYSESNILWNAAYDCTNRQQARTCGNGILDGSGAYQYSSCIKGTPNPCSASGAFIYNAHSYSIPGLNHASGATGILSANVSENNGTFRYTLNSITCNDGVLGSPNESLATVVSCNTNYGVNGNVCSASQNGSCNNSVALGCSIGSAISDNGLASCGTTRTWSCSGLYGGTTSVQCTRANPSCQANPSSLVLTHSTRSKTFTFSWTAGVGNGGSCKLQYYRNGSTWTDISATAYNCDSTLSNQSVTLPVDGWYTGNWNGTQVRTVRTSDSAVLGTFGQALQCATTSGSASSTPNVDEDCNGVWDNSVVTGSTCNTCSPWYSWPYTYNRTQALNCSGPSGWSFSGPSYGGWNGGYHATSAACESERSAYSSNSCDIPDEYGWTVCASSWTCWSGNVIPTGSCSLITETSCSSCGSTSTYEYR